MALIYGSLSFLSGALTTTHDVRGHYGKIPVGFLESLETSLKFDSLKLEKQQKNSVLIFISFVIKIKTFFLTEYALDYFPDNVDGLGERLNKNPWW